MTFNNIRELFDTLNLQEMAHLFHGLGLSSRTYSRHRQTYVDGRSDTLVEQLSFQEDLAVSDGDHVGWNVSRHISGL